MSYFPKLRKLIFFVYPNPKGSEENQFTPLGDGVNKLIFEQWGRIFSGDLVIVLRVIKLEVPIFDRR
jgi:hypothetical protein